MTDFEVVIAGAGPAGISAALHLRNSGFSVAVVDKAIFPRDKTCGDGLTTRALRELQTLGFDSGPIDSWTRVDRSFLHAPSGRIVTLPLPTGSGEYATVAKRIHFDNALVDQAKAAGVTVIEGAEVTAVNQDSSGVTFGLSTGQSLSANFGVGADGMWSPTRKLLGVQTPGYRGEWHAFRQYFTSDTVDSRNLHIWFEPELLPGYAWSFPAGPNTVNFGYGVMRDAGYKGADMARLWDELLTRPGVRRVLGTKSEPIDTMRAWPIPAGLKDAKAVVGRVLFVGDAVRAGDVMTGEGIGQALLTGRLAAEAIAAGGNVGVKYAAGLNHSLQADQKMAKLLNGILANKSRTNLAIATIGLTRWNREQFARWMFEDSPRGILFTPKRWGRGVLNGPGAFVNSN